MKHISEIFWWDEIRDMMHYSWFPEYADYVESIINNPNSLRARYIERWWVKKNELTYYQGKRKRRSWKL